MKGAETKNVLLAIDNLYQSENNIIIVLVSRIPNRHNGKNIIIHFQHLIPQIWIFYWDVESPFVFLVTFPHQYHKLKFCILYKLKNCSRWHFDDDHKQLSYYLLETWCSDDVMRNKKLSPRNHQYCTLNNIQLWIRRDTPYLFPRL